MSNHIQISKVLQKVNGKYEKVKSFRSLKEDELNGLVIKTSKGSIYKLVKVEK